MIYPRVKTAGVYVNLLEGKIFFPKSMVVKMVEQDGEIWRDIWMCVWKWKIHPSISSIYGHFIVINR